MSELDIPVPEIEELLGAYALDAVDPDERRLVEAHLAVCPRCRDELAGHLEVASWMAGGGSRAPEGVWDRIVDALDDAGPAMRLSPADLDVARRRGALPSPRP
jgi:anti-sigma factor RsiW